MQKTDVYMKLKEPLVLVSTIAALVVMLIASSTGLLLSVYADSTNANACVKASDHSAACETHEHGDNPSEFNPTRAKLGEGKDIGQRHAGCVRFDDCGQ
jgi:hypothetical protein